MYWFFNKSITTPHTDEWYWYSYFDTGTSILYVSHSLIIRESNDMIDGYSCLTTLNKTDAIVGVQQCCGKSECNDLQELCNAEISHQLN